MSREENRPIYSFYDGPPFATGMPHYGHILAGTIKVRMSFPFLTRAQGLVVVPCSHSRLGSLFPSTQTLGSSVQVQARACAETKFVALGLATIAHSLLPHPTSSHPQSLTEPL